MKVLQINTVYASGSTGVIVADLAAQCEKAGMTCLCAHAGPPEEGTLAISSKWDRRVHGLISRVTMFKGIGSERKTAAFLKKVEAFSPDIVHLHNLHGSYVNLPMLFGYLKKRNIPVVWTLHDCWPMTAICPHFTAVGCDRWRTGCRRCVQRRDYACAPFDLTRQVWNWKKSMFTGLENAVLVTPSRWLSQIARASFLREYPVSVVPNGIDRTIFRPTDSDFREKHALTEKKIVLGVSAAWGYGKGLDIFADLAKRLPREYAVVLVGADEKTRCTLPPEILCLGHVDDRRKLAQIYSAADVFVNPTREEVLGMVNLEALACGTPVVTARVGGSPECIDEHCGVAVESGSAEAFAAQIERICRERPYRVDDCVARAAKFDTERACAAYIALYRKLCRAEGEET